MRLVLADFGLARLYNVPLKAWLVIGCLIGLLLAWLLGYLVVVRSVGGGIQVIHGNRFLLEANS